MTLHLAGALLHCNASRCKFCRLARQGARRSPLRVGRFTLQWRRACTRYHGEPSIHRKGTAQARSPWLGGRLDICREVARNRPGVPALRSGPGLHTPAPSGLNGTMAAATPFQCEAPGEGSCYALSPPPHHRASVLKQELRRFPVPKPQTGESSKAHDDQGSGPADSHATSNRGVRYHPHRGEMRA